MPTLITSINGKLLAQVCTDGLEVLSVMVQGTRVDDELAVLRMAGGKYPVDAESVYLTWVDSYLLKVGDLVEVTIQSDGATSQPGELFTEKSASEAHGGEEPSIAPASQLFAELRSAPRVREGFRLDLETNHGTKYCGETQPAEHGFGLTVLWNRLHPERARLSLHSYTIDALEHRSSMRYHVGEYIEPYTTIRFQVDGGRGT